MMNARQAKITALDTAWKFVYDYVDSLELIHEYGVESAEMISTELRKIAASLAKRRDRLRECE